MVLEVFLGFCANVKLAAQATSDPVAGESVRESQSSVLSWFSSEVTNDEGNGQTRAMVKEEIKEIGRSRLSRSISQVFSLR